MMGGDPALGASRKVIDAVVRGGADIVEIGIPFSDPIADGRSIQAAGVRSLSRGTRPDDVLRIAGEAKRDLGVPIVLMTYYNIVYSRGIESFLGQSSRHGIDGIIVPDLPVDEAVAYGRMARRRGIDAILLAAPTTPPSRLREVAKDTSGFLYLVSLLGVTGARGELRSGTSKLIRYAKSFTRGRVPLAVGFGMSKPEHVRAVVAAGADGAIVGSAIVDRVANCADGEHSGFREVEEYVRSLKRATKRR